MICDCSIRFGQCVPCIRRQERAAADFARAIDRVGFPHELGERSAVAAAPAFKFQRGPRITTSED